MACCCAFRDIEMGGAECGMTWRVVVLSETLEMDGAECGMTWRVVVLSLIHI